ncbi:AAA family ATPase [Flavobacterium sp. 9AF]|uniref:DNA repair ATPase n=1 Tax=Flavobacterium sp. 9AF TaxID=2653142 RepID=UPI0012F04437|nr:DNA repair ATPase [Flavobacterium sp. 9AF]VXB32137.1 AAA family ATPase [Flavobacterium sp. 9AF]
MSNEKLSTGTYEIIQSRLNDQKEVLIQRIQSLNEDRKKVFGGVDFSLIANERISTDQNCNIKDIFSLGKLCLVGYNTHLGLRTEINLNDVFSAYLLKDNRFEPQPIHFLEDENFIEEFKNLYKYYRNTIFVRFHLTQNYLYFVFQLSNSPSDIKAFKWLIKDNTLTFVDARSAAEVKYPNQQEFSWTKATRDMQRKGSHPHVSLADKVFVEAIGGDITIKVEDNTSTGKGIYSEDVIHKDQTLDDAEIHFFDYNNLVIFKIKPYQESERYFIYNHKEKKVSRVDSLQYSIILLPENQGVIYPNGYALQTGEIKVIATENKPVYFNRRIVGINGENFLFVFYDEQSHDYILIPYNIIKQTIETPINCNGFTLFDNGKLSYFKSNEETKHHLIQIWQTPFTKEVTIDESLKNNLLYKIGNKDLVRVMAECQELNILLSKKDSYSGLYNDIVKQATIILDSYYFLGEKEIHQLNEPLLEIRKIAHAAINEFEKAQEIKNKTAQTLEELEAKCEQILSDTHLVSYHSLDQFIAILAQIRGLRGELISAKELKYADILLIESLEKQLQDRANELSNACVSFLLQEDALIPYQEKVSEINNLITHLTKTIDAKPLENDIDDLAIQLELLVDIVNNLKIEDASHSTQIIENISLIFAQINQQRVELSNKKKAISGKELSADFKAQITLFDQAVINFLELANTSEKCEDFLNKLSIQLEEMEAKFVDFDDFILQINDKREEVYGHFQTKSVQLTEAKNKRTTQLFQSAERILKGVKNKATNFSTEIEINGYFASDLMIEKVRDIASQLKDLNDSNKAEEINTLLKTAQQESIRKLKDKNEIYEDGDAVIAFGDYKFAVNKQKLDLTLVLKDQQYFYHLTGTNFYQPIEFKEIDNYKEVWNQEYISENQKVKRFEYMAWEIFLEQQDIVPESVNKQIVQEFMTSHFGEGLVKGVHDADALILLQNLQQLNNQLGLLKYTPSERALAQLFWFFLEEEDKVFYEKQFSAVRLLKETFANAEQFKYLNKRLSEKIEEFNTSFDGFDFVSAYRSAVYLKEENRNAFSISRIAADIYESFFKSLKEKGKDIVFINQIKDLYNYPSACYSIVENALQTFIIEGNYSISHSIIEEVAAFVLTQNYHPDQIVNVNSSVEITELKSLENNFVYVLDYYEFSSRLDYFHSKLKPLFLDLQLLKKQWIEKKKKEIKLHTFHSQVLTSFVRNKLINDVYFPLIGANLSKQLGALGENKRTDRMGMLLLISPPGYGKTTLMEYIADRMGLVFMKINGPSIGHDITSTDPNEAKNAGAKQELDKLNLAFEMGDNVMLYLDDIQHCNPEFLQKFISLADGQRKIEGIYNGEAKTYDLRSKRFCLVMAGNPYTESGDKFQIPDMLANRADTYNLGDISGARNDLFDLSLIENALMSNEFMVRLTQPAYQNLYKLYNAIMENNTNYDLEGNFSSQEIEDFKQVLLKTIQVRNTVLKANALYIKSAAMADEYRNEPNFKLQGSYRDMNKLVAKIQPILTEKEVETIVLNHYQNESQTLTTGAEANLLKLKELMQIQTEDEQKRWEEIKTTFMKNKVLKGLGGDDRMAQIVALLSEFSEGLNGIKEVLKK